MRGIENGGAVGIRVGGEWPSHLYNTLIANFLPVLEHVATLQVAYLPLQAQAGGSSVPCGLGKVLGARQMDQFENHGKCHGKCHGKHTYSLAKLISNNIVRPDGYILDYDELLALPEPGRHSSSHFR